MRALIHRTMLRSGRGPLGRMWAGAYRAAIWAMATYVGWRTPGVSVYVAGSLGRGEAVYGLSDVDLVLVAPRDPARPGCRRERMARRREHVRKLPGADDLARDLEVCEEDELRRSVAETALTHGLDDPGRPATLIAETERSRVAGLEERPGVGRPLDTWRLVSGPERRPAASTSDVHRRRLDAWLELQHWWRYAFGGCLRPDGPRTPFLCVKLVSEPVRAWLWLEHGEAVYGRRDALVRGLRVLPDEEPALRRALELHARLHRFPAASLDEALGVLARLTARVAARLSAAASRAGTTEVRLVGSARELLLPPGIAPDGVVPLADWRAVVAPRMPDEGLRAGAGEPDDPRAVAGAALAARPGVQPALRRGPLVILPTADTDAGAILRAAQCAVTDPVTHAVLAGRPTAAFPELRGWAARDVARRAVAEHAAWLRQADPQPRHYARFDAPPAVVEVARLLTAARAALFADSLSRGDPELALTIAATGTAARDAQLAEAIHHARLDLHAWHGERRPARQSTVAALRRTVLRLAPYGRPA